MNFNQDASSTALQDDGPRWGMTNIHSTRKWSIAKATLASHAITLNSPLASAISTSDR
jgi:hypothetical protein